MSQHIDSNFSPKQLFDDKCLRVDVADGRRGDNRGGKGGPMNRGGFDGRWMG